MTVGQSGGIRIGDGGESGESDVEESKLVYASMRAITSSVPPITYFILAILKFILASIQESLGLIELDKALSYVTLSRMCALA